MPLFVSATPVSLVSLPGEPKSVPALDAATQGWRGIMPDVFAGPPVLPPERLVLRPITESDGEGLFGIFADDQVTEFYAWDRFTDVGPGHELAARPAGKFRQREAIRWGLVLPGAPRII